MKKEKIKQGTGIREQGAVSCSNAWRVGNLKGLKLGICFFLFSLFSFLFAIGCSDVFNLTNLEKEGNKIGGLRINITDDVNSRTLYPNAVFTKYDLTLTSEGKEPVFRIVEDPSHIVIFDLEEGMWTVTVDGYVSIYDPYAGESDEYIAATGSNTVNVGATGVASVSVRISASLEGDNGFFTYALDFPAGTVTWAQLEISGYTNGVYEERNPVYAPSGQISLPPGAYIMRLRLGNNFQVTGKTSIVYIYSNMETVASYEFEDSDFMPMIALSGTASVSINGAPLDDVWINALVLIEHEDWTERAYLATGGFNEEGIWLIKIPVFRQEAEIVFDIGMRHNGTVFHREAVIAAITVMDNDFTGIELGTYDFGVITLSGTATVTVEGTAPGADDSILILAFADNEKNSILDSLIDFTVLKDDAWELPLIDIADSAVVSFAIAHYNGTVYNDTNLWDINRNDLNIYYTGVTETVTDLVIPDIALGSVNFSKTAPQMFFNENGEWEANNWARWQYKYSPSWLLNGDEFEADNYYELEYTFTSNLELPSLRFQLVDTSPSADWWNSLSAGVTLTPITDGITYDGKIIFSVIDSPTSSSQDANSLVLEIQNRDLAERPIINFTNLTLRKIDPEEIPDGSLETWEPIPDIVFDVNNPNISAYAEVLEDFEGKNDVLHVTTGLNNYEWAVLIHTLDEMYFDKTVKISMSMYVWVEEDSAFAWHINDDPWPVICGVIEEDGDSLNAGIWNFMEGELEIYIPLNPGESFEGARVYLSGQQLGFNTEFYIAGLDMKIVIVEEPVAGDGDVSITFTGIGKEEIDFDTEGGTISLGDSIEINVIGNWVGYEWYLNDTPIEGVEGASYTFTADDLRLYGWRNSITVIVTNDEGTPFSKEVYFTVGL